jgi:phage gp46-like protein
MSIFCEVRAKSWEIQNPLNRRGHFTNQFNEVEGYEIGSKLWLLTTRARNTAQNAEAIKVACQDGLAWLVQDKIVNNYTVEVIRNISQIQINIELQISETETLYKQAFINTFNAN